ncbi:DUF7455 domain-containing protein [Geodermatophilus sp. SYSU D00805]
MSAESVVALPTLADRCDASAVVGGPDSRTGRGACGAQALIRAVLPSGEDLVFCAHHGREHEVALAAAGATVHDGTGAITRPARRPTSGDVGQGSSSRTHSQGSRLRVPQ